MKKLAILVLFFTSTFMLSSCCTSGCNGGSGFTDYMSYPTTSSCPSCCGSGGW